MAAEGNVNNKNCLKSIRLADESDICAIREIWRNIFTPDEDYMNIIFNNLYPLLDAFVYTIDEKITSVAFAIPIALVQRSEKDFSITKEVTYCGRYLYGVATIEEARGRGLSRILVRHIKDYYTAAGEDFIITRPAEESLFPFYKAQGFSQPLYRRETTLSIKQLKQSIKPNAITSNPQEDITAKELYNLRAGLDKNLFEWSIPVLESILELAQVEKSTINYFPESGKYFIAGYNTIQENNFNSLSELSPILFKNIFTKENNLCPHSPEFDKKESIAIIQPADCNFEEFTQNSKESIIKSSITEFALCMPLSEKITAEIIKKSFFNYTME